MSHANGTVYRLDKTVAGYFEYNGTSDVVMPPIWPTAEDMRNHWRQWIKRECTCGHEPEDVILYTDYGMGFHWRGKACFKCMVIVDPLELETTDGVP